jgi:transcriptional regulator with XRE-family HTH domain/KaiC/GvpD/RAD55 family RecA-like ATPase
MKQKDISIPFQVHLKRNFSWNWLILSVKGEGEWKEKGGRNNSMSERFRVTSGIGQLDSLLGGLFIGDNVVWHDDAGSLANVFCMNFIQASQAQKKPIIYVSFDRSPTTLIERLGPMAENPLLTILDCFTCGKGARSSFFMKFYNEAIKEKPCNIIRVDEPRKISEVTDALYNIHAKMEGDVRFIFESMTGMLELWGGEDNILSFYSHSCPRLYELNTVAYWVMEKGAHSPRFRAQINQIAQVAIDLTIKRGATYLTILKAENRGIENIQKPYNYWTKELNVTFEKERPSRKVRVELGQRLKELRTKRGLSQTELAKLIGVNPSTISQIESDLIYPSLPALLKMAEVLSVDIGAFFEQTGEEKKRFIFPAQEAVDIKFPDLPEGSIYGKILIPLDFEAKGEPYLIEIPPFKDIPSHFFIHKGEEIGYILSGRIHVKLNKAVYTLHAGDTIYLTSEMPTQWQNPGPGVARILWIKIK